MNNIFSFSRFSQLFIKHSQEYYKTYLLSVTVLLGLLLTILSFASYATGGDLNVRVQFAIFFFFFIGTGSIFTSMIFSDLSNNRKSIAILTLPASHFEKYLVAWLYSFVIYQVIYVLSFYAIDLLVLNLQNSGKDEKIALLNLQSSETPYDMALMVFATIHSLTFLGAVFFEKLHFIKTASMVVLLCLLVILINQPLAETILGIELEKAIPLANVSFKEGDRYFNIRPETSIKPMMVGMTYAFVLVLWIGTYFRLKEKQV